MPGRSGAGHVRFKLRGGPVQARCSVQAMVPEVSGWSGAGVRFKQWFRRFGGGLALAGVRFKRKVPEVKGLVQARFRRPGAGQV